MQTYVIGVNLTCDLSEFQSTGMFRSHLGTKINSSNLLVIIFFTKNVKLQCYLSKVDLNRTGSELLDLYNVHETGKLHFCLGGPAGLMAHAWG